MASWNDRAQRISLVTNHGRIPEPDMTERPNFDTRLTINELVASHPETISVFNRFGFDTCCGGGVRIDEAAQRDGVDVNDVIAAVNEVLAAR
jgi:regulator of cell morphogenesis and NO signaling